MEAKFKYVYIVFCYGQDDIQPTPCSVHETEDSAWQEIDKHLAEADAEGIEPLELTVLRREYFPAHTDDAKRPHRWRGWSLTMYRHSSTSYFLWSLILCGMTVENAVNGHYIIAVVSGVFGLDACRNFFRTRDGV